MTKIIHNIGGLMCPWVLVRSWMEEVYVCVDEEKYSTIVCVMLDKSLYWVKVARSVRVCPMCLCISDGFQMV